ncbi:MAG TPA: hypothetical protein VKB60_00050 [Terriglobales bacterium]|nr:hypothetical protein [Terriglobales bacterium]
MGSGGIPNLPRAGQPAPTGPADAYKGSEPGVVSFLQRRVPPAPAFYVSMEDNLFVIWTSTSGQGTLNVGLRILVPNFSLDALHTQPGEPFQAAVAAAAAAAGAPMKQPGRVGALGAEEASEVKTVRLQIPLSNQLTPQLSIFPLTQGFILSITAWVTGTNGQGATFAQVGLMRGPVADPAFDDLFISGNVVEGYVIGFPATPATGAQQTFPLLVEVSTSVNFSNAGTSVIVAPPPSVMWNVVSLQFKVVTSAVAGARTLQFTVLYGSPTNANVLDMNLQDTQGPSLTFTYSLYQGGFFKTAGVNNSDIYSLPQNIWLRGAQAPQNPDQITFAINNAQAGDAITFAHGAALQLPL